MTKHSGQAPTLPAIRSNLMASFSADQISDIAAWIRLGGIERQSAEILALAKECQKIADTPRSTRKTERSPKVVEPERASTDGDKMTPSELNKLIKQQQIDLMNEMTASADAQKRAAATAPKVETYGEAQQRQRREEAEWMRKGNEELRGIG